MQFLRHFGKQQMQIEEPLDSKTLS
jgi:hypothetical protein